MVESLYWGGGTGRRRSAKLGSGQETKLSIWLDLDRTQLEPWHACPSSLLSTPRKLLFKLGISQVNCYQISLGKNLFLIFGSGGGVLRNGVELGVGYGDLKHSMWEPRGNWR